VEPSEIVGGHTAKTKNPTVHDSFMSPANKLSFIAQKKTRERKKHFSALETLT
jgi:hypothetical protein